MIIDNKEYIQKTGVYDGKKVEYLDPISTSPCWNCMRDTGNYFEVTNVGADVLCCSECNEPKGDVQ